MSESKDTVVKVKMPRTRAKKMKEKKVVDFIRQSHEIQVELTKPSEFFAKMSQPVESKFFDFSKKVMTTTEEMLDKNGQSKIIEIDPSTGNWRWRIIRTTSELKEILKKSNEAYSNYMKTRESQINKFLKSKEDAFGGFGFADDSGSGSPSSSFPARPEFTPLIGTPFYKQLYLADYWEMHSKAFWYRNYSGIGKLIVDITRNFVMGRGWSVSFINDKAQAVWDEYADRTNIYVESRHWCDDLTTFGENMLRKIPGPKGLTHKSFDPSTIWEIVTDPENISDIAYYHQQYNTQYQIFSTEKDPVSKYVINHIPPSLINHTKVNVTPYEKRGRSDLLSAMLYFKYYEDYMQSRLIRAKNEASFIWDVSIDGSDEDVTAYIQSTSSIVDVPPGSENVHNKAITRTPLAPQFGATGVDQIANDLLSYVAMSVNIPFNYFGTAHTAGSTKAGALVATEPVAKKMIERQMVMESLIRSIVKDVLIYKGLDPKKEENQFEVNFPEIMEEDRSQKIQDLVLAKQEGAISHRTMSEITAKELRITKYDYEKEQKQIGDEARTSSAWQIGSGQDLTQNDDTQDNSRGIDRADTKKDGSKW
jgi:hypothetical protein